MILVLNNIRSLLTRVPVGLCRTGEYTPERDWPPRLAAGVRRWRFQVFPWAPRLRIDSRVV